MGHGWPVRHQVGFRLRLQLGDGPRFQHAIVNVGTFNSPERMEQVLATASRAGWELVTVYDKSSNWFAYIPVFQSLSSSSATTRQ